MAKKPLVMKRWIDRHSFAVLTLWLLVMIVSLYAPFLMGDKLYMYTDIGSDTKNLYTPLYTAIVEKLRIGDFSLWEPALGMGSSLLSFQSTIFDPFAGIIYIAGLLGGSTYVALALGFVHALKILCAGWACYLFLSRFKLSGMSKLIASLLYALNGFMVLWGQHYFFGTAVVLLPLILTAIEQAMDQERSAYFTLPAVVGISAIYSAYLTFMMLLFSAGYVLVRFFQRDIPGRMKAMLRLAGRLIGLIALGVGLAGAIFLPTCYRLLAGGRLDGDHLPLLQRIVKHLFSLYQPGYYKTLFLRLFSNNYQGVGDAFIGMGHQLLSINDVSRSNFYEAPQLFFSVLFIAAIPHYVLGIPQRIKRTGARIATFAGLAALGIMIISPVGGLIFNGFTYPFSRHTFLLMPVFALIVGLTLDQAAIQKRFSKGAALVYGVVVLAVYGYLLRDTRPEIFTVKLISAAAFVLCMGAIYWLSSANKRFTQGAAWLLIATLSISLYTEHQLSIQQRKLADKQWVTQGQAIYDKDTSLALQWLAQHDQGVYRVDKTYASGTNEGMLQGYTGYAMYNGNIIPAYSDFLQSVWPATVLDHASSVFIDEGALPSLLGVKYLLSRGDEAQHPGWQRIHQQNDVSVLYNASALQMGAVYDKTITRTVFDSLSVLERQRVLLSHAVQQGEATSLSPISVEQVKAQTAALAVPWLNLSQAIYNNCEPKADQPQGSYAIHITQPPQVEWILPVDHSVLGSQADSLTLSFKAVSEVPYPLLIDVDMGSGFGQAIARTVQLYNAPEIEVQLTIPANAVAIRLRTQVDTTISEIKTFAISTAAPLADLAASADMSLYATGHGGRVEGSITAHRDGLLVLSIPYERGWEVTIDGQMQPIQNANLMFLSVPITQGTHQLQAVYKAPYIQTGWLLSFFSVTAFIALNVLVYVVPLMRQKRKSS